MTKTEKLNRFDETGRCTLCNGGWLCDPCKADNRERERKRTEAISRGARAHRQNEIARVCMRYQLTSDEFYTREQKAVAIIARGEA